MTDFNDLISALGSSARIAPLRLRQGSIITVDSTSTCTVTIAGSTTSISGIKYASHVCPTPGATCWLATDGSDWFVLATLAPAGPAWGAMRKSTAQSIPANAWTDLSFTSRTDTASYGVTLNNSGLVCVVPGLYQVTGTLDFATNATGQRHAALTLNGSLFITGTGGDATGGGDVARLRADGLVRLTAGDLVGIAAFQSSGAALNTATGAGHNLIRMVWVGSTP